MGERGDDEFRGYWLKYPLENLFADVEPDQPPMTLELRTGDAPVVVETVEGAIRVHPGTADHPDAVISGDPELVIGVLRGTVDLRVAKRQGLRVEGDTDALARVQPRR
jgi:hypothetical protein